MSQPSNGAAPAPDARLEQLSRWLGTLFGSADFAITPASADASFRRYFRVTRGAHSWIAMDAPPEKEGMEAYVRISAMLVAVGVNAPRVLECNPAEGFLLNSDLGSRTYLAELQAGGDADRLYGDAIAALVRIQAQGAAHAASLPLYDMALLERELSLFPEWFCTRHLGIAAGETAVLGAVYEVLVAAALEQPRVFVHRDYHSRNLMLGDGARHGANPGILDFQDAVYGPVSYDLVSLLKDCYVAWPRGRVLGWVEQYRAMAQASGVAAGDSAAQFQRWFDLMGVQRHLKAIGIFARLWHRDGKRGYLGDIPRTLEYVRAVSASYRELERLRVFLEERALPALAALTART